MSVIKVLREQHKRDHPNCTYGARPHYVPPSLNEVGFYLCDPPDDTRNHTRCRPPYDHTHAAHVPLVAAVSAPQEGPQK